MTPRRLTWRLVLCLLAGCRTGQPFSALIQESQRTSRLGTASLQYPDSAPVLPAAIAASHLVSHPVTRPGRFAVYMPARIDDEAAARGDRLVVNLFQAQAGRCRFSGVRVIVWSNGAVFDAAMSDERGIVSLARDPVGPMRDRFMRGLGEGLVRVASRCDRGRTSAGVWCMRDRRRCNEIIPSDSQ